MSGSCWEYYQHILFGVCFSLFSRHTGETGLVKLTRQSEESIENVEPTSVFALFMLWFTAAMKLKLGNSAFIVFACFNWTPCSGRHTLHAAHWSYSHYNEYLMRGTATLTFVCIHCIYHVINYVNKWTIMSSLSSHYIHSNNLLDCVSPPWNCNLLIMWQN